MIRKIGARRMTAERGPPAPPKSEQDDRRGPEQIELLFDRQRPEMADVPRPVVVVVHRVRHRMGDVVGGDLSDPQEGQQDQRQDVRVIGGEDADCTPEVEPFEADAARAPMLVDQDPGDEEARDHEEDADAEIGDVNVAIGDDRRRLWREPVGPGQMADHDRHDGDGAQPVEGRDAARRPIHRHSRRLRPIWLDGHVGGCRDDGSAGAEGASASGDGPRCPTIMRPCRPAPARGSRRRPSPRASSSARSCSGVAGQDRERPVVDRHDVA